MNSIKTAGLSLFLLGSSFVAVDVQAQNVISNPSFESLDTPQTSGRRFHGNPEATPSIIDWRLGGRPGSILETIKCPDAATQALFAVPPVNFCNAADGSLYVNLSSQNFGATISQRVRLTEAVLYRLRFSVAAATNTVFAIGILPRIRVEVTDDNNVHLLDTYVAPDHGHVISCLPPEKPECGDTGDHPLRWQEHRFYFQASPPGALITFSAVQPSEDDASFVDNVVLEAYRVEPLPSNIWLIFIVVSLVGLVLGYSIHGMRRRRA